MKKKITIAVLVLGFALLGYNSFQIHSLKEQLEQTTSMLFQIRDSQASNTMQLHSSIQNQSQTIENLLQKEQSLFSNTSISVTPNGKQLTVHVSAIPKEINITEKVIARLETDNNVYEAELDDNNQASFSIDLTNTIRPSLLIQSMTGKRQESLDEIDAKSLFSIHTISEWVSPSTDSSDSNPNTLKAEPVPTQLSLWVQNSESSSLLASDKIKQAVFVIVNTQIQNETNQAQGSSSETLSAHAQAAFASGSAFCLDTSYPYSSADELFAHMSGSYLPAEIQSGQNGYSIGFSVDLSEYLNRKDDFLYYVYFVVTTTDGITFYSACPIADFSTQESGSSRMTQETSLDLIFESN